jgi:hypothetical protein
MVEVGSLFGRSSWAWAKSVDQSVDVFCIDPWEGGEAMSPIERQYGIKYGLDQFKAYTQDCPNVHPIKAYSPDGVQDWKRPIDLYYEDAVHVDPILSKNVSFWTDRLTPNGIVCGDDYRPRFPHVRAAAERCASQLGRPLHVVDYFWCVLPDPLKVEGVDRVADILADLAAQSRAELEAQGEGFVLFWRPSIPAELLPGQHSFRFHAVNVGAQDWPPAPGDNPIGIGVRITPWDNKSNILAEHRQPFPVKQLTNDVPVEDNIVLSIPALPQGDYAVILDLIDPNGKWAPLPPRGAVETKVRIVPSQRHYALGDRIDFSIDGTGDRYKVSGWVGPEPAYSWCIGSESVLELQIAPKATDQVHNLNITLAPFVASKHPSQRLTIIVNDVEIFQGNLRDLTSLSLRLPPQVFSADSLRIEFRHPDARRPMDLVPGSKDAKPLAFAVKELRID